MLEGNIFDMNDNLFREEVTIYFIKKLQKKKKFDSAVALIAQITRNFAEAKTVLAENLECVDLGICQRTLMGKEH